ncbi:MAG: sugar ABC transporter permease [Thermomicrobiales bacterium]|nr:sugar ABC transporter permease [Thermomicrobiales bacterium]
MHGEAIVDGPVNAPATPETVPIGGKQDRTRWFFLLPGVIWILLFTLFPLFYAINMSLHAYRFGIQGAFVGLGNFQRLLTDSVLHEDLITTFQFVIVAVAIEMVLGIGLALLFNREMRGRGLLRTLATLPLFTTPVALGYLGITLFYEEGGPINSFIRMLGGPQIPWLSSPFWAKGAIVMLDVWQWTPFVFLVTLAGLQGMSQDLTEASQVDGAQGWQTLLYIVMPLLAPLLWLVLLLRAIEAFKVFDTVVTLTAGGPGRATEVISRYTYLTMRKFSDYGYAAAQGFLLLLIVSILLTILWGRIKHNYEMPQ